MCGRHKKQEKTVRKLSALIVCVAVVWCAGSCAAQDKQGTEEGADLVEAAREAVLAARPVSAVPRPAEPAGQPQAETAQAPVAEEQKATGLEGAFDGGALGYTIRFPADWIYDTPSSYQVVFSGKKDSPAYYSTVSIQNILSAKQGGRYKDASEVADGTIGQLNQEASAVKISDEKAFIYMTKDGKKLRGLELKAEYARQDKKFRQWVVVVPRPSGETFHVWSYTSPDDLYNTYYGTAQLMLDSWVIS